MDLKTTPIRLYALHHEVLELFSSTSKVTLQHKTVYSIIRKRLNKELKKRKEKSLQ